MVKRVNIILALVAVNAFAGLGLLAHARLHSQKDANPSKAAAGVQKHIEALRSPDASKREAAACELGKLGRGAVEAVPALIEVLGDDTAIDPQQSCRKAHRPGATRSPNFARAHGEFTPGEAALEALVAIGEPAVEPVSAALKAGQRNARKNAARVLASVTDSRAVEPLIAALKDEAWQVRSEAAVALSNYRDERAVEPLVAALKDSSWEVRADAVVALANFKDERAVEPLISAARDQSWQVRMDAVVSLAHLKDSRATASLINALKDEAWQVRMEAATALAHAGDDRAVDSLQTALHDENPKVRSEAKAALEQINRRSSSSQ